MRKQSELGISLITTLFVLIIVSVIIAAIGYILMQSIITTHQAQVFKSSKQAAESMAYAIINEIDDGNLTVNCTGVVNWCPVTYANGTQGKCPIDLPPDIESALAQSNINGTAYLIANCSSAAGNTYTIEVEALAQDNTTTKIYFIYQK